ncbi:MAG: hypothetical protein ACRCS3_00310 [Paracoccaceae bacterium]
MKHLADNREPQDQSALPQFTRIERQARDKLLDAAIQHPQPRTDGNTRVVEFCRIDHGKRA